MKFLILAMALTTAGSLAIPADVRALCVRIPDLVSHVAMGDVVFDGTVRETSNSDRTATFAVHEQWKGNPLPARVQVHGGPLDSGGGSSTDRTYQPGTRYLVVATLSNGVLTDTSCSATQPWSDLLELLRPDHAWIPAGADKAGIYVPTPAVIGVIGLGILAVAGALAFRRGAPSA